MENIENNKIVKSQVSVPINVHHQEYNDVIRAYLRTNWGEKFEDLTYYEIESLIYSFVSNFISGIETYINYEDKSLKKVVFLNFIFQNETPVKSATIAYIQEDLNKTNNYQFLN